MVNQRPPPRHLIEDLPEKDLKKLTKLLRLPNGGPIDSTWLTKQKEGVDLLSKNMLKKEGAMGTIDNIIKYRFEKATLCDAHRRLQPWLIRRIFSQITLEITVRNEKLSKNEGMRPAIYQWLKGVHSLNSLMMTAQFFRQMFREDFDYTDWRPDMIESGCEACIISYIGGSVKALQDLAISAESRKSRSHVPPLLCKVLNAYIEDLKPEDYTEKMHKRNFKFIKEIKLIRRTVTKAHIEKKRQEKEKRKREKGANSKAKTASSDPFNDPDYVVRKSQDMQSLYQDQDDDGESTKGSGGASEDQVAHFYAERFSTAGLNCAPQDVFDGRGLHPAYRQSYRQSIMSFSEIQGVGGPYRAPMASGQTSNFDPIAEHEPSTPDQPPSTRAQRPPVPRADTPAKRPPSSVYSRNDYGISYSRLPKDDEPPIVPTLPLKFGRGNSRGSGKDPLPRSPTDNSSSAKPSNSNPPSTKSSAYGRGGYAGVANSRSSPKPSPSTNFANDYAYRGGFAGLRESRNPPSPAAEKNSAYGSGGYAGISRNPSAASSSRGASAGLRSSSHYADATAASRRNSSKPWDQQGSAYGPGGYAGSSSPTPMSRSGTGNRARGGGSNTQNTRTPSQPARPDSGAFGTDPSVPYSPPPRAPRDPPAQMVSEAPEPVARESTWVDELAESDEPASPPPPRQEGFELPGSNDYEEMVEEERRRITRWSEFK
ncbi:hypothetical protein BJ875DRAFT_544298 [Amylocarpus encephaloides]|uniref:Uncharacterized protein n=1 Tax=Amylocarpus encephaloides TaxID=45428 RepID=A0A9P7YFN5_9HELO|nr:hypothetical protein BJ875DRAFT_544298 [Amylocarpus encephaloides]